MTMNKADERAKEKIETCELLNWQQDAYDKITHFIDNPQLGINRVGLNWSRGAGKSHLIKKIAQDKFDYTSVGRYGTGMNAKFLPVAHLESEKNKVGANRGCVDTNKRTLVVVSDITKLDVALEQINKFGFTNYFIIIEANINPSMEKDYYIELTKRADYVHSFHDIEKLKEEKHWHSSMKVEMSTESYYREFEIGTKYESISIKDAYDNLLKSVVSGNIDKDTFNRVKMLRELISIKTEIDN